MSSVEVQHVEPITGGYRMYYSSGGFNIQSSSSTDGVNWTQEAGLRISTESLKLDASSVTAFGMFAEPTMSGGPYRAFYVGLDSPTLNYSILGAKSTDGLNWTKDTSAIVTYDSSTYISSLRPYRITATDVMLYYVKGDIDGETGAVSNRRIYRRLSQNQGSTFGAETALLPDTTAYALDVSSVTSGYLGISAPVRLYIMGPLSGETTGSVITTAHSSDARAFYLDFATAFSTTSATNDLRTFAVFRATDSVHLRMYYTSAYSTYSVTGDMYSAYTYTPAFDSVTPNKLYQTDSSEDITILGEVFDSSPTVIISNGSALLTVNSVTRNSDVSLTVNVNPNGAALSKYSLIVANSDGYMVSADNVLSIDYRPGEVATLDNLFRPRRGGKVTFDVMLYVAGNLTAKIYTTNGQLVKTLYDGSVLPGKTTLQWPGDTGEGNTVASGVYLVQISGPKLDTIEKVVVIK